MPDPDRPWEKFGTRHLTDEERAFIEKHKDDIVPIDPKVPQMEPCSRCRGYGMHTNMIGEVDECTDCGGGGLVEARDERGRFLPWVAPRGAP